MSVLMGTAKAGLKPSGRTDLLVVYSEKPFLVSAVYTKNHFKAAPVIYSKRLTDRRTHFRAFVVNSGNANCGTGKEGLRHAEMMAERVAQNFGLEPEEVLVFSTGIIGVPLPIERVLRAIDEACSSLGPLDLRRASEAISTTDAYPKYAEAPLAYGFGKGAGMIHPNMATMLAFVFTPVKVDFETLRRLHLEVNERTFNSITVDGCTSTNDSFLVLSTLEGEADPADLKKDLYSVALSIAKQIVADGEGATKVGVVEVLKAESEEKARAIAEKIATSLLVKTALFGADPNWGRIAAAAGSAFDYPIDPDRMEIYVGDFLLFKDGRPAGTDLERVAEFMRTHKEVPIRVVLNEGDASWTYYTSDLTYDYVRLNAEYTT
ncbi:MAG: bifunctional glutamate N-acetyltransferase/amino-acid acetyltransferase ArgJ [Aquificae bacterium]|nr:bifunctional glutamate N-acetyltransferase/amino-acid acetyltransferase ArgJ [Aquificota bacterium]